MALIQVCYSYATIEAGVTYRLPNHDMQTKTFVTIDFIGGVACVAAQSQPVSS